MFGLEKIADLFDQMHEDNKRFLQIEFQEWVNDVYRTDGEGWKFYAAAATAGTTEALYTVAGGLGAGLVDLLRVGEGVKKGTAWGVAEDTLRVVSVAAGGFRVLRFANAAFEFGGPMSCVVSSSSKAAMLSGRFLRLNAIFDRLAMQVGGRAHVLSNLFPGLPTARYFVDFFRMIGGKVSTIPASSLDEVVNIAAKVKQPVVFSVRWINNQGAHAMVAFRDLLGRVRFADQGGRIFPPSEIAHLVHSMFDATVWVMHESVMLKVLRGGTVGHFIAAQFQDLNPSGMQALEKRAAEKLAQERVAKAKPKMLGTLSSETFISCFRQNSDMPEICTPQTFRSYKVAPGETLGSIARRAYGTTAAWEKIYQANRNVIGASPQFLKAGTTLILP